MELGISFVKIRISPRSEVLLDLNIDSWCQTNRVYTDIVYIDAGISQIHIDIYLYIFYVVFFSENHLVVSWWFGSGRFGIVGIPKPLGPHPLIDSEVSPSWFVSRDEFIFIL